MDAMRAILATAVAFSHAWLLLVRDFLPGDPAIGQLGYFLAGFAHSAVVLFFVLSGYWVTRTVVRRAQDGWSWRTYLIDRLTRLWLVLIPALLLGGALDALGVFVFKTPTHLGETATWVLRKDVAADLSPLIFLGNAFFLQFDIHAFGTNGPLWSVAFEFWYYLWFPALWLELRYRKSSLALLTLVLGLYTPALAFSFLTWLCGSLLYSATRIFPDLGRRQALPILAVATPLLGISLLWSRSKGFGVEDLLLAGAFALFLHGLILLDPPRSRLAAALARFGSRASFSLYAIHFPILALLAGLLVGHQRLAPGWIAMGISLALVAIAVVTATLFARATEARTESLRRYLLRGRAPRNTLSESTER